MAVFRTLNKIDYACNVEIVIQQQENFFLVVVIKFPKSIAVTCQADQEAVYVMKKNKCLRICDMAGTRNTLSTYFVITVPRRLRFRFLSNSSINSDIDANAYQVTATAARLQPHNKCGMRNETLCVIDEQNYCFTSGVVCDGIKNCGVSDWFDEKKSECSLPIEYMGYGPVIAVVGVLVCAVLASAHVLIRCLPPLTNSFFIFNANEDNRLCIDPMTKSPDHVPFEMANARRTSFIPVSSSSSSQPSEFFELDRLTLAMNEGDVPSSSMTQSTAYEKQDKPVSKPKSAMNSMTVKLQQTIRYVAARGNNLVRTNVIHGNNVDVEKS